MLKKLVIAATAAASMLVAAPAANAGPYEECMLMAGCVWVHNDPYTQGYWYCVDPNLAQDCVEP